eukprot:gene8734-9454_t
MVSLSSTLVVILIFTLSFVWAEATFPSGDKGRKTFFSNPFSALTEQQSSSSTPSKTSSANRKFSIQTKLHNYYGGENSSKVREVSSLTELNSILSSAVKKNQLVVLDFTASWCGPCKFISPYFHELAESKEFSKVIFVKVDVDEASEIAQKYQVNAMPTFLFIKDKSVVDRFSGASKDKLLSTIQANK